MSHHLDALLHRPIPPIPQNHPSRTRYEDIQASAGIAPPVQETYHPTIYPASSTPQQVRIRTFNNDSNLQPSPVFLVRQFDATQAYALVNPNRRPITVGRERHEHWGGVYFGVIYPAIGPNQFQVPHEEHMAQYVAIKRLNKAAIQEYLAKGGVENPYKEMVRMEVMGDNEHVLRHVEFLEDDTYLYIVTPKGKTLKEEIPWLDKENFIDRVHSQAIFRQILRILLHLQKFNINHHDVSPDNFLILPSGALVLFDFALSLQIPFNTQAQHRALISQLPRFGTLAWMDPLVYMSRPFDGLAMDLWAAGVILYNLLTNQILCRLPIPTDVSFCFCLLAGSLSSEPLNERAIEMLHDIADAANEDHGFYPTLVAQATAHLNLSAEAIEVLVNMLQVNPAHRYTLAQTIESAYVQGIQG